MTVEEKVKQLHEREALKLTYPQIIELCFDVMTGHRKIEEKCRAAVILSGIIQKDLPQRVLGFLEAHPDMPARVHEVLRGNIQRMGGF